MTETGILQEELTVDRSPELMRGKRPLQGYGHAEAITLTPEAVRGDGSACALAVALCAIPDIREAHIEGELPYVVMNDGSKVGLHLGTDVVEWIGRFDRGEPVEPLTIAFTF